ncbi:dienelactone hydrolase [Anoxybacillus voinovskiensis]|uniref:Dienelactone hydrolase n=1 Tax=Anoxybacteroides voinovskiense TaxID=230470 RepID=A0A840DXR3_9BACL|nr:MULTISPECIES: dienelactone hydrolase family protein [Anoxybacillus]MBB4075297.1 dienelactone hydrolase [Anoxybacillus voinovskiensis]GGJ77897.1 hypothetical protein GCM10008982_29020 [Anoxybacillus voinovskiensis]
MLKHCNDSNVAVVLIHEIYGINDHMKYAAQMITAQGYDVYCPNLLNREAFHYNDEKEAYQYFRNEIGFEQAKHQTLNLAQSLKQKYETVVFWGYSVGATVAWLCSEYDGIGDAAIGYYGSRIRDYTDLRPKMSVLLLFAEQEPSVDVHQLTERLSCTSGVNIEMVEGAHGFADPFSRFYHPESEKRALDWSFKFIETIRTGEK